MEKGERSRLIYQISDLLDNCEVCEIKKNMLQGSTQDATLYSKFQKYCNTECSIGQKLQSFGTALGSSQDDRFEKNRQYKMIGMESYSAQYEEIVNDQISQSGIVDEEIIREMIHVIKLLENKQ